MSDEVRDLGDAQTRPSSRRRALDAIIAVVAIGAVPATVRGETRQKQG